MAFPRKQLIEERVLAKSAFGDVVLAKAPKFPFKERLSNEDPESECRGVYVGDVVYDE